MLGVIKVMDSNASHKSLVRFASHESTIESLNYAKEDLAHVEEDLVKANDKIAVLEEEVKRLTDELNRK